MSYPLRMNKELYNKIFERCRFTKKGMLMKEIFVNFDDFVFARRYSYNVSGEYLIYFSFDDSNFINLITMELSHIFPKDIANEIAKYCESKYYIERIYKFCSCEENREEFVKTRFRIKERNDIRKILSELTVHTDKDECMKYLNDESFCFDSNLNKI